MTRIGFAAVGVGGRLTCLVKDLLATHGDKVHLTALCDNSPQALAIAREKLGFEGPTTVDPEEAITTPGTEWVLVGSRNDLHAQQCLQAFAAGKHVFCEKPLATSIGDCIAILDAHRRAGTKLMLGFVLRYLPLFRELHGIIEAGTLGRIVSMEANETLHPAHGGYVMRNWRRWRRYSGPHVLEKGCHDMDLMQWLLDSVPTRVAAFGGCDIFLPENRELAEQIAREAGKPDLWTSWGAWEDLDPFTSGKDIDDNLVAILEFRNGTRATWHQNACDELRPRGMHLCGLKASVDLDLRKNQLDILPIGRENTLPVNIGLEGRGGHHGTDGLIMDDLVRIMTTSAEPAISAMAGVTSAITSLAIDQARQTGRIVDLEPYWKRVEEIAPTIRRQANAT